MDWMVKKQNKQTQNVRGLWCSKRVLSALNAPWSQNITRQFEQIPDLVWELKRDWGLTYSIFSLSSRRGGRTGFYGGGCRAHSNPNPSIQKCRMEEGKPYTIHHRARLHREESSMATSHLKSGQIQQQEHTGGERGWEIKRKETKGVQAGHKSFQSSAFPLGPDETPSKSSASTSGVLHAFVRGFLSCVGCLLNLKSGWREKIQRKYW